MFCNKCGKELPDNAAFCTSCGNKIQVAQAQPTTSAPQGAPVNRAPLFTPGTFTNPFAGGFNQATILKQESSINLIAILVAVIGFFCAFMPAISISGSITSLSTELSKTTSIISGSFAEEVFGGAFVIIFPIAIVVIYALKRDNLGLIVSAVNFIFSLYLLIRTGAAVSYVNEQLEDLQSLSSLFSSSMKELADINIGFGVIFYFILSIVLLAVPFIWQIFGAKITSAFNKAITRN